MRALADAAGAVIVRPYLAAGQFPALRISLLSVRSEVHVDQLMMVHDANMRFRRKHAVHWQSSVVPSM